MPRHDPNDGATYSVKATRADGETFYSPRAETLPLAKREMQRLLDLDLDGDCFVEVEVVCHRGERTARCLYHRRGESELRLRRALLALRRSTVR